DSFGRGGAPRGPPSPEARNTLRVSADLAATAAAHTSANPGVLDLQRPPQATERDGDHRAQRGTDPRATSLLTRPSSTPIISTAPVHQGSAEDLEGASPEPGEDGAAAADQFCGTGPSGWWT